VEVFHGKLSSLRRFKDDAKEVLAGFECGIGIEDCTDLKVGDILEVFETIEIARTLSSAAKQDAAAAKREGGTAKADASAAGGENGRDKA